MEAPNTPPEDLLHGRTIATYCHLHFASDARLAPAVVSAARRTQRVTSLIPSGTEMLAHLLGEAKARERLIGVSEYCDYPQALVRGLDVVSASAVQLKEGMSGEEVDTALKAAKSTGHKSAHTVDVEWLASKRPGIVLTQDTCKSCDAAEGTVHAALEAAGLERDRAITLKPITVGGMLDAMRTLGQVLGEPEAAIEAVVGSLTKRLDVIKGAIDNVSERPRVLGLESLCPLVASGQWLPDMRIRAGGVDALGDEAGGAARVVTLSEVDACAADVIVICCCGRSADGSAAEIDTHLLSRPEFWQLPAMRSRPPRLYAVSHEHFSRPGPRLVDGIETLAALLHPDLLPKGLVDEATAGVLRLVGVKEGANGEGVPVDWRFEPCGPRSGAAVAATHPPIRSAATLVASNTKHHFLLFGGEGDGSLSRTMRGFGDVWDLGPPRGTGVWAASSSCPDAVWEGPWECGATANEEVPTPRSNHAVVACGDHLLVFGGWSADGSTPLAEPELLHLETRCWTHCSTTNAPPPPRGNPTLVYSRKRHLAVMYGGWNRRAVSMICGALI